ASEPVLRYAIPVSSAWLFGVFINHADQFFLSLIIQPEDFALYAIGCLAIPPLYILENSVTRVLIPRLSNAFKSNDSEHACRLYSESVGNLAFLIIPSVAGLVVFAEPIISILFTERYLDAANYLRLFAFSYLALIIPFDATARAQGLSVWILKYFSGFSIATVALTVVFTSQLGPIGALMALLLTKFAMRVFVINYMHKALGWPLSQMIPVAIILRYSLASLVLSLLSGATYVLFSSEIVWFVTVGPVFALLYLGYCLTLKAPIEQQAPKVLMVTQSVEIGGLEKMILYLSRGLSATHEIPTSVFCYDHNAPSRRSLTERFNEANIPLTLYTKPSGFSPAMVYALIKEVYRQDITIVHAHDLGSLMYAVIAKVFCTRKIRLVLTQHSFVHLARKNRYTLYEKIFTAMVDEICCVSTEIETQYRSFGITNRYISVIPNGVDFPHVPMQKLGKFKAKSVLASEHEVLAGHQSRLWLLYLARVFPGK
ncbi:MAG: glycosyltransferase, partial [Bdellovibrionales bacterium]|nr:glycosyltransferase [Bdellovibrionales bacterium]